MDIVEMMCADGHEKLVVTTDAESGLKFAIAIHDRSLGPALGGIRMFPYPNSEDMIADVLRLSKGMTYKNAIANIPFGGGKSVVWADPKTDKTNHLLEAVAKAIDDLGGQYFGAEDMGMTVSDIEFMSKFTKFMAGKSEIHGGSGDPSLLTALGLYHGIRACLLSAGLSYTAREDPTSFSGLSFAIQGVGAVGRKSLRYLLDHGASRIIITDNDPQKLNAYFPPGIEICPANESESIYDVDCDVFLPCAVGAILNDDTIPRLRCKIVAGAANNQLQEQRHGDMLKKHGILYAPDYVINAGGVINVSVELSPGGYDHNRARMQTAQIFHTLRRIFIKSERNNIPTNIAADRIAEERLQLKRKGNTL